jgi:nucleotide-binding universal stress UspA family protein
MMFHKILVPLDGSTLAERALPTALALARSGHGAVILLRCLPFLPLDTAQITSEYDWLWQDEAAELPVAAAETYLRAVQDAHQQPDIQLTTRLVAGDAAGAIVDTAAAEAVDLIVISSHGYTGLSRWLLGSVAEKTLRSAPCPALVIRSAATITRMLIPLDGSDLAELALAPGLEIARCLGAEVTLLRVNQPSLAGQPGFDQMEWVFGTDVMEPQAVVYEGAETYLNELAHRHAYGGRTMRTAVRDGSPAATILEYAADHQIELIVMSTHGRTGLQRWVYGSVTDKVLHSFDGSMLVIRPPVAALKS